VFTDPNMPAMAANAYSILFGDFARHYVIRDVVGVRFERSDDYAFATDQITFRALLRTDGERVDLNAVKAYRNSAT
jgi:HK97 family phage major capsid protein